jgi:hypothetical protein
MTRTALAKRAVRPLARPFLRLLDERLATVVARVDALAARLEFVRKELLLELRYSGGNEPGRQHIEPSVVNADKLAGMRDELRVNLGAGHLSRPDYVNVDGRALDGIDVVADLRDLPFEPGSVSEVYSAHVLEHFPVEELRRVLLPHWVSRIAPGGRFVAVVPDLDTMVAEYAAGRLDFDALREVLYGSQEYDGDFHFNGFTLASLGSLLEEAGLCDVTAVAVGRRNGLCYEMEVAASRPGGGAVGPSAG